LEVEAGMEQAEEVAIKIHGCGCVVQMKE